MANKNTRQAKKRGLTNNPEVTIGTGAGRGFGTRTANPIFKGTCCNTARPAGKYRWMGAEKAAKFHKKTD